MVAPAPVSAAACGGGGEGGAFGIVRVVYDVFGAEALTRLDLTRPLLWLAAATILYGSLRLAAAGAEAPGLLDHQPGVLRDPRRRAARTDRRGGRPGASGASGVDEGDAVLLCGQLRRNPGDSPYPRDGWRWPTHALDHGGVLHRCAGHDRHSANRRLHQQWTLGLGALEVGQDWVLLVLLGSALLNAAYFLPLLCARLTPSRPTGTRTVGPASASRPTGCCCYRPAHRAAVTAGRVAGRQLSPLGWSQLIVEREFAI